MRKKTIKNYRSRARKELGIRDAKIPSSKVMMSKKKRSMTRSSVKKETRKEVENMYNFYKHIVSN